MSRAKSTPAAGNSAAKRLVQVKVWMEQSLIDQLNAVVGEGSRSELIRDLVAHRLLPHPALASTLQLNRLCARIEKWLDRDYLLNPYEDNPAHLEELRAYVRELVAAATLLRATMATELLRSAGMGAGRP